MKSAVVLVFPTHGVSGKERLKRPLPGLRMVLAILPTACAVGHFQTPLPGLRAICGCSSLRQRLFFLSLPGARRPSWLSYGVGLRPTPAAHCQPRLDYVKKG